MSESPTALRSAKEVQEPEIHRRRALWREWRQGRGFVATHDTLEHEYTVVSVIKARRRRQDAGRGRHGDGNDAGRGRSVGERRDHAFDQHTERFAKATRTRLRIRFEP